MKVRLTNKVHRYSYDGKQYLPGDVFEVPRELYRGFMVEVKDSVPNVVAVASASVSVSEEASMVDPVELVKTKLKKPKKPVVNIESSANVIE